MKLPSEITKLKRQRQDIADLQLMGDNYVQEIARRYHRLVLMTEAYWNAYKSYYNHKDRVLRDAGYNAVKDVK